MSEADMGLTNKGSIVKEGSAPGVIDAGMPSGGSPGNGDLMGVGYAGEHTVGSPVASGPIK